MSVARVGEPVADRARARRCASCAASSIGGAAIPTLIDELPLLACIAAYADGETRVTGAGELRVKESDRITAVVDNLRALGADAEELPDGFVVTRDAAAAARHRHHARRPPAGDGVRDPRRAPRERDRDRRSRLRGRVVSRILG